MIFRVAADVDSALDAYRSVGTDPELRRLGLFVAEGRMLVRRVLEDGRHPVQSVLVTPAAFEALGDVLTATAAFPVYVADQQIVDAVTGFNFHRGCVALVERPPALPEMDSFVTATRLLALERIGNADNVGGLFRAAGALGADGVLLDEHTVDPLYRKAIRTSMGATLRVPYARAPSWPAVRESLGAGFTFAALTLTPDATPIECFDVRGRSLVLMLGGEGDGLLPESRAFADVRLRIPIDTRFDSLNVVVAAGIALHALRGR